MPYTVGNTKEAKDEISPSRLNTALDILQTQIDGIDSLGEGNLTNVQRDTAIRQQAVILRGILKIFKRLKPVIEDLNASS